MNKIGAAVILNGGKSSRMGSDKSQLIIEGQTLLERAVHLVSAMANQVYVSGRVNAGSLPTLPDFAENIGPMGGILGALESLPEQDRILFIPVDMPFLTRETLSNLIEASTSISSALVDMRGAPIPVVAVYTQETGKVFRDFVESGNYGLQVALREMQFNAVQGQDARECMNINTPEDFQLISKS
jgi:molybdopterin-guanine dinucleotide biosynthesis protein A